MTWGLLTEVLRNRYFQVLLFYHDKLIYKSYLNSTKIQSLYVFRNVFSKCKKFFKIIFEIEVHVRVNASKKDFHWDIWL